MAKIPCNRMRPVDCSNPYETYQYGDPDNGGIVWHVLKHYQSPEKERENPYARVMVGCKSPYTYGSYDLGDCYLSDIFGDLTYVDPEAAVFHVPH